MLKNKTILVVLILVIMLGNVVFAKGSLNTGYFNSYKGTIGDEYKIRMLLFPDESGQITGNYFYEQHAIKIPLKGFTEENEIILFEYNEENNKTGKFVGQIIHGYGRFKGEWTSLETDEVYPFDVKLNSLFFGVPDNPYINVGANSPEEVEEFTAEMKGQILEGDKYGVARNVAYPININVGGKLTEIKNEQEFEEAFHDIFYTEFIESIRRSFPINMFCNYQGIMFGDNGEIWLNYFADDKDLNADGKDLQWELKIISINTDAWKRK